MQASLFSSRSVTTLRRTSATRSGRTSWDFYVSQLAVSQMRIQKSGHVVAVTTSLVSQPVECLPASLANLTKGGLESVTRALAIEFAKDGIRFNAIAPGVVNTPMHRPQAHDFLKQLSPMKRLAE